MDELLPMSVPVRAVEVVGRRERSFRLAPDAGTRAAIAAAVGAEALDSLVMEGVLRPEGRRDLLLEARLRAGAVMACVVTLAPVPVALDVPVQRHYVAGMTLPEETEVEMPEDDTQEPLPDVIDLGAVMIEALALALPDYPRAEGAVLDAAGFGPPGVAPLREADLKPFAGLAGLRDALRVEKGEDEA